MNNDIMSAISGILSDSEAKEKILNSLSQAQPRNNNLPATVTPDNMAIIMKIKETLDRLNNTNDSRIGLLNSIRPFMRNGRERSIDTAIKFIQIMNFASGR